jgi:hypothetical protein
MRHRTAVRGPAHGLRPKIPQQFGPAKHDDNVSGQYFGFDPRSLRISALIISGARQQDNFAHTDLTLTEKLQKVLTVEMKINPIAPDSGPRLIVRAEVVAATNGKSATVDLLQGTTIPMTRPNSFW